ncbi:MAG TPA: hypothetical protein VKY74_17440 [Chloroflexia bacterium]|nr:hypothetical protein [Chloroflexia bacterium]
MDTTAREKKLAFVRRMIWWLPGLAFAIWAAVIVAIGGSTSYANQGGLPGVVLQALLVAIVVGILCVAFYFGYKYMLDRNPNL